VQDQQWTLMNYSSDFTSQAIMLTLDDLQGTLDDISSATARANKAIKTIALVNKVISIAASATALAATIMSGNADGAISAAQDLFDAASS
jgi:hypothetical protein